MPQRTSTLQKKLVKKTGKSNTATAVSVAADRASSASDEIADATHDQQPAVSKKGKNKRTKKPTKDDLPPPIRALFTDRIAPLVLQFFGTQPPWSEGTFHELKRLYEIAVGKQLARDYPLEEMGKIHNVVREFLLYHDPPSCV